MKKNILAIIALLLSLSCSTIVCADELTKAAESDENQVNEAASDV